MDTKKARVCAPLLPPPGGEVLIEALDDIDTLRAKLAEAKSERASYGDIMTSKLGTAEARLDWLGRENGQTHIHQVGPPGNTAWMIDDFVNEIFVADDFYDAIDDARKGGE